MLGSSSLAAANATSSSSCDLELRSLSKDALYAPLSSYLPTEESTLPHGEDDDDGNLGAATSELEAAGLAGGRGSGSIRSAATALASAGPSREEGSTVATRANVPPSMRESSLLSFLCRSVSAEYHSASSVLVRRRRKQPRRRPRPRPRRQGQGQGQDYDFCGERAEEAASYGSFGFGSSRPLRIDAVERLLSNRSLTLIGGGVSGLSGTTGGGGMNVRRRIRIDSTRGNESGFGLGLATKMTTAKTTTTATAAGGAGAGVSAASAAMRTRRHIGSRSKRKRENYTRERDRSTRTGTMTHSKDEAGNESLGAALAARLRKPNPMDDEAEDDGDDDDDDDDDDKVRDEKERKGKQEGGTSASAKKRKRIEEEQEDKRRRKEGRGGCAAAADGDGDLITTRAVSGLHDLWASYARSLLEIATARRRPALSSSSSSASSSAAISAASSAELMAAVSRDASAIFARAEWVGARVRVSRCDARRNLVGSMGVIVAETENTWRVAVPTIKTAAATTAATETKETENDENKQKEMDARARKRWKRMKKRLGTRLRRQKWKLVRTEMRRQRCGGREVGPGEGKVSSANVHEGANDDDDDDDDNGAEDIKAQNSSRGKREATVAQKEEKGEKTGASVSAALSWRVKIVPKKKSALTMRVLAAFPGSEETAKEEGGSGGGGGKNGHGDQNGVREKGRESLDMNGERIDAMGNGKEKTTVAITAKDGGWVVHITLEGVT